MERKKIDEAGKDLNEVKNSFSQRFDKAINETHKLLNKPVVSKGRKDMIVEVCEQMKKEVNEQNEGNCLRLLEGWEKLLFNKSKQSKKNEKPQRTPIYEVWKEKEKQLGGLL